MKIGDLNRNWMRECESIEEIRDLMKTEQLLDILLPSFTWVREKKSTTGVEASELADEYV